MDIEKEERLLVSELVKKALLGYIPVREALLRFPPDTKDKSIHAAFHALVHLEAVMVLRDGRHILRARLRKELHPFPCVKIGCSEQRYEVLIAEALHIAEALFEVLMLGRTLAVHVAGIPFAECLRHAEHAPVDEDAELALGEPCGRLVGADAVPVGLVFAVCVDFVDLSEILRDRHIDAPFVRLQILYHTPRKRKGGQMT